LLSIFCYKIKQHKKQHSNASKHFSDSVQHPAEYKMEPNQNYCNSTKIVSDNGLVGYCWHFL